ncbi:NUDIX domain-containing protein [Candidatus Laterigemmans baculatus]|uniref:NUDIX domain-containing protein n=1 Tax=Candidatus Laterigemmans baculatus TaxID=2770505 RepID=UPI0028F44DF0|nr:NUDIX domain-containing protein [Candidatus Laterigemmans baculatus]
MTDPAQEQSSDPSFGGLHVPKGAKDPRGRRGVVGVIMRDETFLVIRRSQRVAAPGLLCFAGGGIEPGESEPQALIRELQEELALEAEPVACVWRSVTAWGTQLAWWTARIEADAEPVPNPAEVEAYMWMRREELEIAAKCLPSMPQFLSAWAQGEIEL